MSNRFFQQIKDKKAKTAQKELDEQRAREDHLRSLESELQEMQNQHGLHIPHPVKAHKKKQEIKQVQKEIVAHNKRKSNRRQVLLCGCALLAVLGGLGAISSEEEPDAEDVQLMASESTGSTEESVPTIDYTVAPESNTTETITVPPTTEAATLPPETEESVQVTEEETAPSSETTLPPDPPETSLPVETTVPPESTELAIYYAQITAENLSVHTSTDYSHVRSENVKLGENEGVTITIAISKPDIAEEDIVILYDDTLLDVKLESPVQRNNTTVIEAYVTGKVSGASELWIFTSYELESAGENASGYPIYIHKLDSTDGRVVYITPSGERYHWSAACAGKNAIKTTYSDAISGGYTACKKCS